MRKVRNMRNRMVGARGRVRAVLLAATVTFGLVACSAGTSDTTETADRPEQLGAGHMPEDFDLSQVVATDSAGWVIGRSADASPGDPEQLWRLDADGSESLVAELTLPQVPEVHGVGDLVAVAEVRCDQPEDREPNETCLRARGLVHFHDDDGVLVATHELWEGQDVPPISGSLSASVWILGSSEDTVWVLSEQTIFEVTADDGVAREVPPSQGRSDCPIDGTLYSLRTEDRFPEEGTTAVPADGPPAVSAESSGSDGGADERTETLWVEEYRDGDWVRVGGGERTRPGPVATCTGDGIEVVDSRVGGEAAPMDLIARWDPQDGWATGLSDPGITADEVVAVSLPPYVGRILQRSDGDLLSRRPDGAYTATGLSLPVTNDPESSMWSLTAAESSEVIVGCVRDTAPRPTAGHEQVLTCAAAERQEP